MNDFDALLAQVTMQSKKAGVPVSDRISPHVRINSRAVRRFGRCISENGGFVIELSSKLLDAPELSCRQTIAHELIHTCKGCMNHGELFKKYAAMMNSAFGYSISRTNSCEEMGVTKESAAFVVLCSSCGARIERLRRSAVVTHPERYRCKCGGKLVRVR